LQKNSEKSHKRGLLAFKGLLRAKGAHKDKQTKKKKG